jgi:oxygen-independent coproporphyrinogen-3 oxidase
MGYTTQNTSLLIGLGMSSISDSWFGFAQNEKTVEDYIERVNQGEIPVFRGHILSEEDLVIRRHILDLMCHFETSLTTDSLLLPQYESIKERLKEMEIDGLVTIQDRTISISQAGIPFVRNACMAFDMDLQRTEKREGMFSKTV